MVTQSIYFYNKIYIRKLRKNVKNSKSMSKRLSTLFSYIVIHINLKYWCTYFNAEIKQFLHAFIRFSDHEYCFQNNFL